MDAKSFGSGFVGVDELGARATGAGGGAEEEGAEVDVDTVGGLDGL